MGRGPSDEYGPSVPVPVNAADSNYKAEAVTGQSPSDDNSSCDPVPENAADSSDKAEAVMGRGPSDDELLLGKEDETEVEDEGGRADKQGEEEPGPTGVHRRDDDKSRSNSKDVRNEVQGEVDEDKGEERKQEAGSVVWHSGEPRLDLDAINFWQLMNVSMRSCRERVLVTLHCKQATCEHCLAQCIFIHTC
jgi:hypothetical protein